MPRQVREQLSIVCWCFAKHDLNLLIYASFNKLGFRQSSTPQHSLSSPLCPIWSVTFLEFYFQSSDWVRRLPGGVAPRLPQHQWLVAATGSDWRLLWFWQCKQEQSAVRWHRGTPWYTVVHRGRYHPVTRSSPSQMETPNLSCVALQSLGGSMVPNTDPGPGEAVKLYEVKHQGQLALWDCVVCRLSVS